MFTTRGRGLDRLVEIISRVGRGGRGQGGSSVCRCPNCGYTVPHDRGVPCSATRCPRCSTPMRGENC